MVDLRGYVEGMIGFEGSDVIANPTETPTDDLESIQIGNTIYNVGGGGEEIVPTPTDVDRGKYLGVKSNANELEYREVREVPSTEGANAGDVLTHTISGESWLPPVKELPTYTISDNGKVLGISNNSINWVTQSSGLNYSTAEQVVGTWYDGKPIYQKTYVGSWTLSGSSWSSNITNIPNSKLCKVECLDTDNQYMGVNGNISPSGDLTLYNLRGTTLTGKIITVWYTKTTDTI